MNDPLTEKITQARNDHDYAVEQQAAWQHRVEIAKTRLEALEQAAQLRPLPDVSLITRGGFGSAAASAVSSGGRKGRQPGAISQVWRTILRDMSILYPEGASDDDITAIGRTEDLPNLRPRDVRRQMEGYRRQGIVYHPNQGVANLWRITPGGAAKFNIEISSGTEPAADSQSAAVSEIEAERE